MSQYVYGVLPVLNYVQAGNAIKVFISESFSNKEVIEKLKRNKANIITVKKEKLASFFPNVKNLQGIIAEVKPIKTYELSQILDEIKSQEKSIVLVLDGIEDPHNFGAILRIADAFNVSCVIYKKNGQVSLNETTAKVSTGAINYVKCVEVANLNLAIEKLKDNGFWIYAADGGGSQDYFSCKYTERVCLIIGSEGFGISKLVLKNSDIIIKIPMAGHVNSLNASNATSIILSHIFRR